MKRPLLFVLGAITFAFMSIIFFWVFKLTMADSKKSDMVPPEKVAAFIQALLEANRPNYTDNVVVKLQKEGIDAHEHWKDERGVALPAQYLMESGRLVALKGGVQGLPFARAAAGLPRLWTALERAVADIEP